MKGGREQVKLVRNFFCGLGYELNDQISSLSSTCMTSLGLSQRTGIETNEHEDMIAKDAVNPSSIDVTFEDIGG